ncbi:DUF3775 domain-containing protein [Vibrio cholerae]|uniref:DUF3775 domain-containing protein n=1 Tax=Vibrio cholerae TaxID=666 RepID=UPI00084DE8AA|nr:DUF3775 domain-containing protein [Vibrio cholerae]EGQ8095658.1 DUF3775 domain-containing protein [Vibrio cholerae]OEG75985.1 hypothetical protein VCS12_18730 [Vibrio cholerae]
MKNEINNIIQIESKIINQSEKLKARYGIKDLGLNMQEPKHMEYVFECNKISEELSDYLKTLSDDDLSQLVALMYAGRDRLAFNKKDEFNQYYESIKEQGFTNRNTCIRKICEKEMSLSTYYSRALNMVHSLNFDVDTDFHKSK